MPRNYSSPPQPSDKQAKLGLLSQLQELDSAEQAGRIAQQDANLRQSRFGLEAQQGMYGLEQARAFDPERLKALQLGNQASQYGLAERQQAFPVELEGRQLANEGQGQQNAMAKLAYAWAEPKFQQEYAQGQDEREFNRARLASTIKQDARADATLGLQASEMQGQQRVRDSQELSNYLQAIPAMYQSMGQQVPPEILQGLLEQGTPDYISALIKAQRDKERASVSYGGAPGQPPAVLTSGPNPVTEGMNMQPLRPNPRLTSVLSLPFTR